MDARTRVKTTIQQLSVIVAVWMIASPAYASGSWLGIVGGEWDFVANDGPPISGEDWKELRLGLGYTVPQAWTLLPNYRLAGRGERFDHVLGVDGYAKVADDLWIQQTIEVSPDHDFVYRFKSQSELEHQIGFAGLGLGYWYIDFTSTDVHTFTPFVRAYIRDFTLELRYMGFRDTTQAQWFHAGRATLQDDSPRRWIRPVAGLTYGDRIFGILTLQQSGDQGGWIGYLGNRFGVHRHLDLDVRYSVARESSVFSYHGVAASLVFRSAKAAWSKE